MKYLYVMSKLIRLGLKKTHKLATGRLPIEKNYIL